MHHANSILFGWVNALLERIFGPVSSAPTWWREGITVGGFHIDGIAPHGEHAGEYLGWLPDHVIMALFVFAFCAIVFPLAARRFRSGAPAGTQNVLELFVDFLGGVIKENIPHDGEKYLPIAGAFFFFIALSTSAARSSSCSRPRAT